MEYITSHIWQSSWAMENYHQHDMPQFLLMFKGLLDIIFDLIIYFYAATFFRPLVYFQTLQRLKSVNKNGSWSPNFEP